VRSRYGHGARPRPDPGTFSRDHNVLTRNFSSGASSQTKVQRVSDAEGTTAQRGSFALTSQHSYRAREPSTTQPDDQGSSCHSTGTAANCGRTVDLQERDCDSELFVAEGVPPRQHWQAGARPCLKSRLRLKPFSSKQPEQAVQHPDEEACIGGFASCCRDTTGSRVPGPRLWHWQGRPHIAIGHLNHSEHAQAGRSGHSNGPSTDYPPDTASESPNTPSCIMVKVFPEPVCQSQRLTIEQESW
jgi:hypothetical protein